MRGQPRGRRRSGWRSWGGGGGAQRTRTRWRSLTSRTRTLGRAPTQINEAVVVAVGAGGRTRDGASIPMNVAVGDKVMLPEYGGQQVKLDEKEYFLFRDEDILAKLE